MFLAVMAIDTVALLMFLGGCLALCVKLRNFAGASLLLSVVALIAWTVWGQPAFGNALVLSAATSHSSGDSPAALIALVDQTRLMGAVCESLLLLWFGASFFIAIRSIKLQRSG